MEFQMVPTNRKLIWFWPWILWSHLLWGHSMTNNVFWRGGVHQLASDHFKNNILNIALGAAITRDGVINAVLWLAAPVLVYLVLWFPTTDDAAWLSHVCVIFLYFIIFSSQFERFTLWYKCQICLKVALLLNHLAQTVLCLIVWYKGFHWQTASLTWHASAP